MRDTLALALVRAELCRDAAMRHRLNEVQPRGGPRAALGRMLCFIRRTPAKPRHERRTASEPSSPD